MKHLTPDADLSSVPHLSPDSQRLLAKIDELDPNSKNLKKWLRISRMVDLQRRHSPLADLFYTAVHHIPADIYSQEQKNAWAPKPDYDLWEKRGIEKQPFIIEKQGIIVVFAELDHTGYIDCFYIHPDFQKQHIGTFYITI